LLALLAHVTWSAAGQPNLTAEWLEGRFRQGYMIAVWSLILEFAGVYAVIQPSSIVEWVRRGQPGIAEHPSWALAIIELVGLVMCAMGLLFFLSLLSGLGYRTH